MAFHNHYTEPKQFNMKKALLITGLLLMSNLMMAQESIAVEKNTTKGNSTNTASQKKQGKHHTPEQKADLFMVKITEAITLDDAQKSKVKSLALDHFKYMETVRQKAMGDKEKIKAEAKNSRKILNEGLKKVLSPAQFETWKAKRKESVKKQETQPGDDLREDLED